MFENMVVIECLKQRFNQGKMPNMYFYRDSNQNEIDLIVEQGNTLVAVEIKSSATYSESYFAGINRFAKLTPRLTGRYLVYNGQPRSLSESRHAIRFNQIDQIFVRDTM